MCVKVTSDPSPWGIAHQLCSIQSDIPCTQGSGAPVSTTPAPPAPCLIEKATQPEHVLTESGFDSGIRLFFPS